MLSRRDIIVQAHAVISSLIETGLADDSNAPIVRELADGTSEVTHSGNRDIAIALRSVPYADIYQSFAGQRNYIARMPDGALIQMMYLFRRDKIERHRLAFFPSPHLEDFQNNAEIYIEDVMYAEVVSRSIMPVPIRFDFDNRPDVFKEIEHPISHLTLGQFERCRIPVVAPLTPIQFVDFIVRNFYNSAFVSLSEKLPKTKLTFKGTIHKSESEIAHIAFPCS
jgi:hypothetical protein